MSDDWLTSWYWNWRPIGLPAPGAVQPIPDERAQQLGRLLDLAIGPSEPGTNACFLALARERLSRIDELAAVARLEYRVSVRTRFPETGMPQGVSRKARLYIHELESTGGVGSTRGPFHLSEVIAQGGIALITARADLLTKDPTVRIGTYVPVAITRGGGPLEPMRIGLWDPTLETMVWTSDDMLSRAWHAPHAGGEMLTVLPSAAMPSRPKSGCFRASLDRIRAETIEARRQG